MCNIILREWNCYILAQGDDAHGSASPDKKEKSMNKRLTRALALTIIVVIILSIASPVSAAYSVKVKLNKLRATINLAKTDTLTLSATVTPASAARKLVWKSGNEKIAKVSSSGVVRAQKAGKVKVGARVPGKSAWSICTIIIKEAGQAPTSVTISESNIELSVGQTKQISATFLPEGSSQECIWLSSAASIVSVEDGLLTAKSAGKCYIRVRSTADTTVRKSIIVIVKDNESPSSIEITPGDEVLNAGDKLQLGVIPYPAQTSAAVVWSSSDRTVARVSSAGLLSAISPGTTVITATSLLDKSVKAKRTISVTDNSVTSITIDQEDSYLAKGDVLNLTCTLLPDGTAASVKWTSDNTSVASVNSAGRVTAIGSGTAVITAKAGGLTDDIEIRVLSSERVSDLPDSYVTSAEEIAPNVALMKAIYASAIDELDKHVIAKDISSAERANRKAVIVRAFDMYNVPWMTDTPVTYWSSTTSYKVGRIYLGMPYTQTNRTYNLSKWLDKISYTENNGIYSVTMPNRSYPGNDCSSFVSMCQFGTNTSSSYLNTTAMYSSTSYKTISNGYTQVVPGDVLVKVGHTAMFLYYVTSDRIMVIEQGGGSEPNTVSCHVKSISGVYRAQGYRVRRKIGIEG